MLYCPYANIHNNLYYRDNPQNSFIRVFHAAPNAPAVDVYVNGNSIVQNLSYKQFSPYFTVAPGSYNIKVYPAGQTTNPIIDTNVNIPQGTVYNLAIIGTLPSVSLYPIQEPRTAQNFGRPCVRFVHLSPNAPAVDIALSNGKKIFNNVSYKGITDYVCVPSGTYTFYVSPTGTNNVVLTIPNVQLMPNSYYTVYLVGLAEGIPSLEGLPVLEPR